MLWESQSKVANDTFYTNAFFFPGGVSELLLFFPCLFKHWMPLHQISLLFPGLSVTVGGGKIPVSCPQMENCKGMQGQEAWEPTHPLRGAWLPVALSHACAAEILAGGEGSQGWSMC